MSVNFLCGRGSFCQIASTFHEFLEPYVSFRQLFVRPRDLPSTSVYFKCIRRTIRQLFVHQQELSSTFRTSVRTCVNFCQHTVCLRAIPLIFCELLCSHGAFHQLPHIFRADAGPSVKFHQLSVCAWDIPSSFRCPRGLPSNSINFRQNYVSVGLSENVPRGQWTLRQLLSTF